MGILSRFWVTCGGAALIAAVCVVTPEPAQAQFGFGIGPIPFNIHIGPRYRGGSRHRGPRRSGEREESRDEDSSSRQAREDKVLASLGAPSSAEQSKVLKGISASPVLGVVGSTKDLQEVGKPQSKEDDRDYTQALERIIQRLERAQDKRVTTPGDATAHGIEQALQRAIKSAKLDEFERFVAESWTAERIRVLVLERVYNDLDPLFRGTTRGNVPMADIESLIQRAAEAVYRRVFETSELLAANRASNQFIQRLYQATSGRVENRTRDIADSLVKRGSAETLARYEALLRNDDNSYAHRYRAQRVIYDCLSANMERIVPKEVRDVKANQIEGKIKDMSTGNCEAWLKNQFGAPGTRLKAQQPVPMRVVWSENGPIDDPSMYTRSLNRY